MASFSSFWAIFLALIALTSSLLLASSSPKSSLVSTNTISAAPSSSLSASPTQSPEIEPLFPTPSGVTSSSPTDSSLPIIPSSPSPPNPQVLTTPGSVLAFPPLASMPASSQASSHPLISVSYLALHLLVIFILQQFHGM